MMTSDNSNTEDKNNDVDLSGLKRGEQIKCLNCHNGYYKPFSLPAEKCDWFKCDNCGDHVHFTPNIIVE